MTYLDIIWNVLCTEVVIFGAELVYFFAVGLFGKTKYFDHYDE